VQIDGLRGPQVTPDRTSVRCILFFDLYLGKGFFSEWCATVFPRVPSFLPPHQVKSSFFPPLNPTCLLAPVPQKTRFSTFFFFKTAQRNGVAVRVCCLFFFPGVSTFFRALCVSRLLSSPLVRFLPSKDWWCGHFFFPLSEKDFRHSRSLEANCYPIKFATEH